MPALIFVIIVGVVFAAHTVPFPFLLEAFRPSQSLWRVTPVPGSPPTLYLTFDDGPNAQWTPPLLDALRDTGVNATFFLITNTSRTRQRGSSNGWWTRGTPSRCTVARAAS